jgi:hypothetical protein
MTKSALELTDVASAMEVAASEPDAAATFRAIEELARRLVGFRLFTVMRNHETTAEVERLHSSDVAAYPVGGRKRKEGTRWGEKVLDRGEVFLARNRDELRDAFPDYELIFSLGISAILNVPIRHCGRCIGTMNLCGDEGQYGQADIGAAKVLAGLLVPALVSSR